MNRVSKWVGAFLVFGILFSLVFSVRSVSAGLASDYGVTDINDIKPAIQKLEWVDAAHIKMTFKNGKILVFTPSGIGSKSGSNLQDERLSIEGGDTYGVRYVAKEVEGWTCGDRIRVDFKIDENLSVFDKQSLKLEEGRVDIDFRTNSDNDCSDGNEFKIAIENPELSIAYFKWVSETQIGIVDGDFPGIFTKGVSPIVVDGVAYEVFLSDRESSAESCRNKLLLNRAANTVRWYDLGKSGSHDGNTPDEVSDSCGYYNKNNDNPSSFPRNNYDWGLANSSVSVEGVPPVSGNGDIDADNVGSCESSIDNGFGWIICPILDGADKLINVTENTIKSKLEINSEFTNNEGLHDAWTQLARISSGLLVILALVMIISTALGFEMVSSYTMKKMLPRIVIGAIGIWLSWALATTYVNFMNDLGRGITNIMFEPFKDTLADGNTFANVDLKYIVQKSFAKTDPTTDLAALGVFSVPIISLVVGSGGIFGILAAAVPAIGAMLIGLFLLTLRQIIIVFLLVLAPIGVAAWMLPNTEKAWKLWSGTFNKLLLMYPLFMGAFAAGKIFALVAADATKTDNGVLEVIVPMLAYISPFFFIPVLFKLAGSIFGNITGMVNNKGKGAFDKLKGDFEKRRDLRPAALAKANREKLRAIKKNVEFAEGQMKPGALGRYRRARYGGLRQSTRDKMQAAAIGVSAADDEKNLKDYNALLDSDYRALSARGALPTVLNAATGKQEPVSEGTWLKSQALRYKGAKRQAAIDRLVSNKEITSLEELQSELRKTDDGKVDWVKATRRNFGDLHPVAPHLSLSSGDSLDVEALGKAAPLSMVGWNKGTWKTYAKSVKELMDAGDVAGVQAAKAKIQEIWDNDKGWGDLSDDARKVISDTFGARVKTPKP